jgi:hypothetical protein
MRKSRQAISGLALGALAATILLLGRPVDLDGFARCLEKRGVVLYTAWWCTHCQNEKAAFKDSYRLLKHVECGDDPEKCKQRNVESFPTWATPDGILLMGEQNVNGFEDLSAVSGCKVRKVWSLTSKPYYSNTGR